MPDSKGTIRLFRLAGIDVFLHWSWFVIAVYEIQTRNRYSAITWSLIEYLSVFAIVTLHEFGHALACRQVGGRAERIVLWPLGGVAYVSPPPRPGANLWSIAAGPLVNVALMPVLGAFLLFTPSSGSGSDLSVFLRQVNLINAALFIFNVLPIYPLDGGKILRSLLWYAVGRAQSLMASVIVGFAGVAGMGLLALRVQSSWFLILALYAGLQCVNGYKQAQALKRLARAPRREHFICPSCYANPPKGSFWVCASCRIAVDIFETNGVCPRCARSFAKTACPECGEANAFAAWVVTAPEIEVRLISSEAPSPPSIVTVLAGVLGCLAALAFILIGLLFFVVSSNQTARQPRYQAEMEKLWSSEGITMPGEESLNLRRREQYSVYIERSAGSHATKNNVEIQIVNDGTGQPVSLLRQTAGATLQRSNRKLTSAATFTASADGVYTVRVSASPTEAGDARVKVGPEDSLVTGAAASLGKLIGIAAIGLGLMCAIVGVFLFRHHKRRRREFNSMLQRLYQRQTQPAVAGPNSP